MTLFITSRSVEELVPLLESATQLASLGESVAFLFFGDGVCCLTKGSTDSRIGNTIPFNLSLRLQRRRSHERFD